MPRKKKTEGKIEDSEEITVQEEKKIADMDGPAEAVDAEGEEVEEEGKFAFPNAAVVRLIRSELDSDKMIRRKVKEAMNMWLEKVARKVSKKMNQSEYTVLEIDDFKTAIEPYELIDEVEEERKRIVATLEKIKMDCDSLIRDVNRKFISEGSILFAPQKEPPQEPAQPEGGQ